MATELPGASRMVEEPERFHGLHPLKRFKILQKERVMQKRETEVGVGRQDVGLQRENEVKVCNLPAKKRVCALQFFTGLADEEEEQENRNLPRKKNREASSVAARALQPIISNRQVPASFLSDEKAKEVKMTVEGSSAVTRANLPPILNRHVSVPTEAAEKASVREQQQNLTRGVNRQVPVTTGEGLTDRNEVQLVQKRREAHNLALQHTAHRQLSVIRANSSKIGERDPQVKVARNREDASLALANRRMSVITAGRHASCDQQVSVATMVNCRSALANADEDQGKEMEMGCDVKVQQIHDIQMPVATGQTPKGAANEEEEKCSADKGQGELDGEDDGVFCDVCKGDDAEPSDPIVFCDGCNVMVHPSCYGSPLIDGIPDGDWFCRQCESESRRKKVDERKKGSHVGRHTCASRVCCLCPSRKGAMKQTTGGAWAHLSCALYVPEVFYRRARDREGIECGSVPAWRWELPCVVCSTHGKGSCIQCTEVGCSSTFHVSCALNAGLTIDFRNANAITKTPAIVIAFCPSHSCQALTSSERRRFKIVPRAGT